jgi:pectate lyase
LQYPGTVKNADAITIDNSQRVYLDHVSASWATDEVISTYRNATDLTIAYSILAEGIMPHSKCTLLGSNPTIPQNITFWRNACISNNDRNPDNNHLKGSCVEIANNIFFNARSDWAEIRSQFEGGTTISLVENYFKAGNSTRESTYAIVWKEMESIANPTIFQKGNVAWAPKSKSIEIFEPKLANLLANEPPCPLDLPLQSAEKTYEDVQANSGAFPRDEADARFTSEIGPLGQEGNGSIKDVAGQLPASVNNDVSYVDDDLDGIADAMEEQFGGTTGVFDAWSTSSNDGWSNFDKFMQWLSEERISGRYVE